MITDTIQATATAIAASYIVDAFTPMHMPTECSEKKGLALLNWTTIASTIVALALAVFGAYWGFFLAPIALVAAYTSKHLALRLSIEQNAARLERINETFENQTEAYQQQVTELHQEVASLQQSLEQRERLGDQLRLESQRLERQLEEEKNVNEAFQKQVEAFKKIPANLEKNISELSGVILNFSASQEALDETEEDIREDIQQINLLNIALKTTTDNMESQTDSLEEQTKNLQQAIDETQGIVQLFHRIFEKSTAIRIHLGKEIDRMGEENIKLRKIVDNLGEASEQLQDIVPESTNLSDSSKSLIEQAKALKKQLESGRK